MKPISNIRSHINHALTVFFLVLLLGNLVIFGLGLILRLQLYVFGITPFCFQYFCLKLFLGHFRPKIVYLGLCPFFV